MIGIHTPAQAEKRRERLAEERHSTDVTLVEDAGVTLALSARIAKSWQAAKSNKTTVEHNMLECLRERRGEYGPHEKALIAEAGGSDIYIPLATAKIRAGIAHIKAVLLPAGARAYGIEPTRNPSLPKEMQDLVKERIMQNPNMVDGQGQPIDPMAQVDILTEMAVKELAQLSKSAARSMERKITDQLQEGGWASAMSDFIDDLCTYPAAFIKGPYYSMEPVLTWERGINGMVPVQSIEKRVKFRAINPFDAYPAPGVDSVHRGDFIERLRMSRGELYRMRDMPGYSKEAILAVMADYEGKRLENWLWTDAARHAIADHNFFWYASTSELDGLHWYGRAQGTELIEWGMDPKLIPDPFDEYEVDAIQFGRHVVKAAINTDPLYRRPIHSTCYEKVPGSVFGNAPSMLMRNTQRMVNATGRALQNNLAHASGFQVEVDYTRVSAETDAFDLHPFKVWQTRESEFSGDRPAVRFFQPTSNAPELINVIDYFKRMADNDTGIPEIAQGSAGTNEGAQGTARGQAMLLDQSAKLLRSAITNVDKDVAKPKLEMMYDNNMLYDPDESIKGDAEVVAKGANAMLQRESSRQAHMALLEVTNNPVDQEIIGLEGRAHLLKQLVGSFEDIDQELVLPGDEALEQRIAQIQAARAQQPPDPALMKVQAMQQIEAQRLQLDGQRLAMEGEQGANKLEAEMQIKQLEFASEERVAQARLDKERNDEIIRLRATRMAEREKMQIDVMREKMKAEVVIRTKVEEMRAAKAAQPEAKEAQVLTQEEVRNIVESVIVPQLSTFQSDTAKLMDTLAEKMNNETGAVPEAATPQVINVHIDLPDTQPVTKRIATSRDARGNLQATVTPTGVPT